MPTQGSGLGVSSVFSPFPLREDTVKLRRGRKGEKENQIHRTEKTGREADVYKITCSERRVLETITCDVL